ncbi:MAG: hypothetical protein EBU01_09260, partial [Crocinitomicaceae bacterium]|nr:hypothetical protein [Crocinitomicaceae bacterium]
GLGTTILDICNAFETNNSIIVAGGLSKKRVLLLGAEADTVNLNPQRFFDKIPPRTHIRCLSCGTESLSHLRHPITYKSIVKHYEHVLHLVSEINGLLICHLNEF